MLKVGDKVKIVPNEHDCLLLMDYTFTVIDIKSDTVFLDRTYFIDSEFGTNDIHESYLMLDKNYYRRLKINKLIRNDKLGFKIYATS